MCKIGYNTATKMHYIGVDIIEVARIEEAIACWGEQFLHRVYTDSELKLYRKQYSSLAVRFAAKEAVIKALSRSGKNLGWKEIEILSDPAGRPVVHLYGKARTQAEALGLDNLSISLSHCKGYAIAFALGEAK